MVRGLLVIVLLAGTATALGADRMVIGEYGTATW